MSWTAPRTWVTGETLTSTLLNTHVRDNLLAIGTSAYPFAAFELARYTSTSNTTSGAITGTGSGDLFATLPAVTLDGATSIAFETAVTVAESGGSSGLTLQFAIFEGVTQITNWAQYRSLTSTIPSYFLCRHEPTTNPPASGSHTYLVRYRAPGGGTWQILSSATAGDEAIRSRIVKL